MSSEAFFAQCCAIGKKGEDVIFELLKQRTDEVIDVRSWDTFRKKDIDFRCFMGGQGYSVEVKTDSYISSTNNIAVELYDSSNISHEGKGWYSYTETDVLVYVCRYSYRCWFFRMEEIRNYIDNGGEFTTKHSVVGGNQLTNALINIEKYKAAGNYVQYFDVIN